MTGRRSHGRLSALNGVVHQGRSVRVNVDVRIIVHRSEGSLLLCYMDHHDKAYHWAEQRKLETHPKTGAAQLVEIRKAVREIVVPAYTQAEPEPMTALVRKAKPRGTLFADRGDDELLGYGVPAEWLDNVREADEDSLLALERLAGPAEICQIGRFIELRHLRPA